MMGLVPQPQAPMNPFVVGDYLFDGTLASLGGTASSFGASHPSASDALLLRAALSAQSGGVGSLSTPRRNGGGDGGASASAASSASQTNSLGRGAGVSPPPPAAPARLIGTGKTLEAILRSTDAFVANCRRAKDLESVADVRAEWFARFYENIVARFAFTEALERALWRVQTVVRMASGRGAVGRPDVERIIAETTDEDLCEAGVQFVLCHTAAAFSVAYNTYRELLEVRHIPYLLLGNGMFAYQGVGGE